MNEDINDIAEDYCGVENAASVWVCGNHIKVVSSLVGGGATYYKIGEDGSVEGEVIISSPKVFELRYRVQTTRATNANRESNT